MSGGIDQAEGLRRLLTAGRPRMIAVVGMAPAAGATTAATNLSIELARQGKPVLLLDEHGLSERSACGVWAVAPAGTLAEVASGRMDLTAASAQVGFGVRVLPAHPNRAEGVPSPRGLCPQGVIVVDVVLDPNGQLSPLAKLADEMIVVMQPSAASITATYARLKQMQYTHALQTFQFLVNHAADARQAQQLIANVVNTSSRYLTVSLRPIGWVTSDPLIREAARLNKTVCEAYPSSVAARELREVARAIPHAGHQACGGRAGSPGVARDAVPSRARSAV